MLRTGTLWFAVGFHFAFDYMQLFVIGTPNGARFPAGRMLDARFCGFTSGGAIVPTGHFGRKRQNAQQMPASTAYSAVRATLPCGGNVVPLKRSGG